MPKHPRVLITGETSLQDGTQASGYLALSNEAMMAGVARRIGRAPGVVRSVAAGTEPMLRPTDADIELRCYTTSRVPELLGMVHASRKWSSSRKEQPVLQSRWALFCFSASRAPSGSHVHPCPHPLGPAATWRNSLP